MTQGEKVGRGGEMSVVECLEIIMEKMEPGDPVMASIKSAVLSLIKDRAAADKEVAELRGKVASLEKERKLLKFETDLWYHHCGNGSTALAQLNKMEAERDEARGLLREAAEHVSPVSHQGPTADELRAEYPEACALVDGLRARIDALLRKSP